MLCARANNRSVSRRRVSVVGYAYPQLVPSEIRKRRAHKIDIKGDGRLELVDKPFTVEDLGDGRWNLQISLDGATFEEELRRLAPHIAAELKITEDQLREQLLGAQFSLVSRRPDTSGYAFALGGLSAVRSLVKASLVLWSTSVGNDELKRTHYQSARRFVVEGDERFNLDRTCLDSRLFRRP